MDKMYGNTDMPGNLPGQARLDQASTWCTANTTHPKLGVKVPEGDMEVRVTSTWDILVEKWE